MKIWHPAGPSGGPARRKGPSRLNAVLIKIFKLWTNMMVRITAITSSIPIQIVSTKQKWLFSREIHLANPICIPILSTLRPILCRAQAIVQKQSKNLCKGKVMPAGNINLFNLSIPNSSLSVLSADDSAFAYWFRQQSERNEYIINPMQYSTCW